jgi:hypothetical protein
MIYEFIKPDITKALFSLRPNSMFSVEGETYEGIRWNDQENEIPTEEELLTEIERLQAEYDAVQYKKQRYEEYPDFREYLDGIVKGDQQKIDAYIAECNDDKAKYP